MKLILATEEIHLLPQKAFFWPRQKLLGFSDVHIGKAESFQSFGIPLPSGSHLEDLDRISQLIASTQAEKVFVLGDWIHQKNSWAENIVTDLESFFLCHKNIDWTLLIGNHERGSIENLKKLPFHLVDEKQQVAPFIFTHGHLKAGKNQPFQIQGHIHPVVRIKEGSTRLRLPCFVLEENTLTLPSFGSLTGGYEISPSKDRQIFAVTEQSIFEVPNF